MVKICGAAPVVVSTSVADDYCLTAEALRRTLEQHAKVTCLILCNPSNPTGCVPTRQQLQSIADVLRDFPQVAVISDEIYERLLYDGWKHTSFASLDGMQERTVTVNGPSKAYSMTGFRIGYSASPLRLAKAISKLQSQITSCASSISQRATLAAMTQVESRNPSWLPSRVAELRAKRDLTVRLLNEIPHVQCAAPPGAFYVFPDVSHYFGRHLRVAGGPDSAPIDGSHALCVQLLRTAQVALVPGEAFGADSHIRLCYAAQENTIREAVSRLKTFLLSLGPREGNNKKC